MARLQEATQRLRQAIQNMAQQPEGERRNAAIRQAHQALFDAQQAMILLPPELYTSEGREALPNYTKSMERLQQAAQKLREAVQAMAEQPAGTKRNAAAREAREAILETQQAMVSLPPHLRSQAGAERTKADTQAANRGSGATSVRKSFSELDGNNDGFLSMIEAASDRDALSNFEKRDRNKDYKLSRSEWEAGRAPAAGGGTGSQNSGQSTR
ncbi:MAG: hypothetical protein ACT4PS_19380 [Betaproteobacteria bacterium]